MLKFHIQSWKISDIIIPTKVYPQYFTSNSLKKTQQKSHGKLTISKISDNKSTKY
jgi:hypothetical protein